MLQVLVFRTSIRSEKEVLQLRPFLDRVCAGRWSFDLDDGERILRMESECPAEEVSALVTRAGHYCEELEDIPV
jgi:hypothetical protein